MNGRDFYDCVVKHDKLEWLGSQERAVDEAIVLYTRLGTKHIISIPTILEHSWDELEAVLTGRRAPRIMIHLTRIVGYYSRVQNWNRSKLAELKARQAGDYTIGEQPKKKKVMVPGVVGRQSVGAEERSRTSIPEGAGC